MTSTAPQDRPLTSRPPTFLVAKDETIFSPASTGTVDFDFVVQQLRENSDVDVQQELTPRTLGGRSFGPTTLTERVVVATMPDSVAAELRTHPQILLEENSFITPQAADGRIDADPGLLSPFGTSTSWTVTVTNADGQPVSAATVYLYGAGVPAQGRTDANGAVTLSLVNETDATLRALYVNPQNDYWSLWVNRPALVSGAANTVTLESLTTAFPGFPSSQLLGWGQRAMRLDQVPSELTGRGVKVAVIDSGAAALTHPDLAAIDAGIDLTTTPANSIEWSTDTIAHGSHCSGIIAGADNGGGVRGFAPEAELYEARIFPGGRISSLIDAVDYCIEQQIDVVNMSLGSGGSSQIMLQKLAQAKDAGVACIVAAGNSGGGVQFPGTSPDVLTVAAIGQEETFPATSYHAKQRWSGGVTDQGYFSAQFSCHGKEVGVCGPGVAIVSSVPDHGFASWDGTSMATPHIAGLAALVLAHHPDFQTGPLSAPSAARVDHLFEILKSSATRLAFGDPHRSGAGLPDALRALGRPDGAVAQPSEAVQDSETEAVAALKAQLQRSLAAAGLTTSLQSDVTVIVNVARVVAELQARLANAGLPASWADFPRSDRGTTTPSPESVLDATFR